MGGRHGPRGGRVDSKGTRPGRRRPGAQKPRPDEGPDLLADLRGMLASDHPVDLLCGASQLVEVVSERPLDKLAGQDLPPPSKGELVALFLDVDLPESTALLSALAPLLGDELLGARIRRELALRDHHLPPWVAFDQIEVTAAWGMTHVLGDGENVMIGARWATGHEAT